MTSTRHSSILVCCACLSCVLLTHQGIAAPQFPDREIGKAGGEPINAAEVLQPIYRQLTKAAASTDKETFVKNAAKAVAVRVYTVTYSRLVAYDVLRRMPLADRSLFERSLERQKQQLIKQWGNGDAGVADQQLRKEKGVGLAQVVRDAKAALLIQEMQKSLAKLIPAVTENQIDEYVEKHADEFNLKDQRHIRLIRVEAKHKGEIESALKAGKPFAEVAKNPNNLFRADRGGDMGEVPGKQIFADENVNKATLALKSGETSKPIAVGEQSWWVHVEKLQLGQEGPTKEQREQIGKQMFTQQYSLIERQYRGQLFRTVEHTQDRRHGSQASAVPHRDSR